MIPLRELASTTGEPAEDEGTSFPSNTSVAQAESTFKISLLDNYCPTESGSAPYLFPVIMCVGLWTDVFLFHVSNLLNDLHPKRGQSKGKVRPNTPASALSSPKN